MGDGGTQRVQQSVEGSRLRLCWWGSIPTNFSTFRHAFLHLSNGNLAVPGLLMIALHA